MNNFLSNALDAAVVPGFSKIGFAIRKRLGNWQPISAFDLRGKTVVITGPTSGLGEQVARQLAPTGDTVDIAVDALCRKLFCSLHHLRQNGA